MDKFFILLCFVLMIRDGRAVRSNEISQSCFQCLCEAFQMCDLLETGCMSQDPKDRCGPYRLTRDYWTAAGLDINNFEFGSYEDCTRNVKCSQKVIQRHSSLRLTDCDGNGRINCFDVGLVYNFGDRCPPRLHSIRDYISYNHFVVCNSILKPADVFTLPKGYTITDHCFAAFEEFFVNDFVKDEMNDSGLVNEIFCKSRKQQDFCGPLLLSRSNWSDVRAKNSSDIKEDYFECAGDPACSELVLQRFFDLNQRDCDANGVLNCLDVGLVHFFGRTNCHISSLRDTKTWNIFLEMNKLINPDELGQ